MAKRVVLIVLDSVGVGAMPDADSYGDAGSDTLGNVIKNAGKGYELPNMAKLGLYNLLSVSDMPVPKSIVGSYGKMALSSPGKDTTVGHWEMAGIVLDKPFPTYPNGFPKKLIEDFEKKIGSKTLGNITASGIEIIQRLGDEHCRTKFPIVYTSADSVFQIAAHEEVYGLDKLYKICEIAREMLSGENAVGRVIARPFIGSQGNYIRTANRIDYALPPISKTILDKVTENGGAVIAIGKIDDIFSKRGISRRMHTHSNTMGMLATWEAVTNKLYSGNSEKSLVFTNLVDFDMLWGHRRDAMLYARGLKEFDKFLPSLMARLDDDDILMITADHGCDPTYQKHTDHTREFVPLLVYGKKVKHGVDLGTRKTFADVAQTIADVFEYEPMENGTSFKKSILSQD